MEAGIRIINNIEPNERIVVPLIETIEAMYERLVDAHVTYVNKRHGTLTEEQYATWADTMMENHKTGLLAARKAIGLLDADGLPPVVNVG